MDFKNPQGLYSLERYDCLTKTLVKESKKEKLCFGILRIIFKEGRMD